MKRAEGSFEEGTKHKELRREIQNSMATMDEDMAELLLKLDIVEEGIMLV